jgi:hypothetical protein
MVRALEDERSANEHLFGQLHRNITDPRLREVLELVMAQRAVFTSRTDDFVRARLSPVPTSQSDANSSAMLDAFIKYQTACDHLADLVRANSLESSSHLAREVAEFRLGFLVAGALPVLLGLAGILLTLSYVLRTPLEADLKE